jgi:hypothetical protein
MRGQKHVRFWLLSRGLQFMRKHVVCSSERISCRHKTMGIARPVLEVTRAEDVT